MCGMTLKTTRCCIAINRIRIPIEVKTACSRAFTLNGLAEIVAASLLADDLLVDLSRGDVVVHVERDVEKALVVAQVEVDLAAIVEHEHLAVLEWREGARVDVYVRIDLDRCDLEAAALEQAANARRDDALADAADHAASYQQILHSLSHTQHKHAHAHSRHTRKLVASKQVCELSLL